MPTSVRAHARRGTRGVRPHLRGRRKWYENNLYPPTPNYDRLSEEPLWALIEAAKDVNWSRRYEAMAPVVYPGPEYDRLYREGRLAFVNGQWHSKDFADEVARNIRRQDALKAEFARRNRAYPQGVA